MLILKILAAINLNLTAGAKKKALFARSLLNEVLMLLQCYGLVDGHFFKQRTHEASGAHIVCFCFVIE